MATKMIGDPGDLKKARNVLGFTQIQAGVALGGVRSETISRWENSPKGERPKVRAIHVETTILFIQIADLLVDLYPDKENRTIFLHSSQGELSGQSPHKVILEDPPYGLRYVLRLLGRMAEGIPT